MINLHGLGFRVLKVEGGNERWRGSESWGSRRKWRVVMAKGEHHWVSRRV